MLKKNQNKNNNCIVCKNWSGQVIVENNHLAYEEKIQFWLIDGNKWVWNGGRGFLAHGCYAPHKPQNL
jgi:hypothetical protein